MTVLGSVPEQLSPQALGVEPKQYTFFTRLSQGYKHSPTLAHHALSQELEKIPKPDNVDILALGVEPKQYTFFTRLSQGYKHSPTLAHHALSQELEKIPKPDNVDILIKMPESRKDLQQALGLKEGGVKSLAIQETENLGSSQDKPASVTDAGEGSFRVVCSVFQLTQGDDVTITCELTAESLIEQLQ
ncbi:hypothetical protein IHE44_0010139, partial [Lamprotornis superbus]